MSDSFEELIKKLEEMSKSNQEDFNEEDVKVLKNVVGIYLWLQGLGKLGKMIIWFILTLAAVFTAISSLIPKEI